MESEEHVFVVNVLLVLKDGQAVHVPMCTFTEEKAAKEFVDRKGLEFNHWQQLFAASEDGFSTPLLGLLGDALGISAISATYVAVPLRGALDRAKPNIILPGNQLPS